VWVATGFAGNGMTMGTMAATILTDLVVGRESPLAAIFDATRIPVGEVATSVKENAGFPAHLVGDRLAGASHLEDLGFGEGQLVSAPGGMLAVSRDDKGSVHAVSAVCTHLGCLVRWNSSERSWDCPAAAASAWTGGHRRPALHPRECGLDAEAAAALRAVPIEARFSRTQKLP
jgi:Rieske Fe-S protein